MKSDKSSKAVNVDGQPSVFARHNTEMNIPRLPLQRGERAKRRGDVIPSKGEHRSEARWGNRKTSRRSSLGLGR